MSKQKIGGVALMIFGIIVLLYVKIFPSFITFSGETSGKSHLYLWGFCLYFWVFLILFIKKISF